MYYYAITCRLKNGTEDLNLVKNSNYTSIPVEIVESVSITSLEAENDDGDVIVNWQYKGAGKTGDYILFRSTKKIRRFRDVIDKYIIDKINLNEKNYVDEELPMGRYYYGLIPSITRENKRKRLKPGVNIIRRPVQIKKRKKVYNEENVELYENVYNLNIILKKSFFKGRYDKAVKELQNVIKSSDNKTEVARAKLFLGRSYIELRKYKNAIELLVLKDVKKYFPDESQFWLEYAIMRVR